MARLASFSFVLAPLLLTACELDLGPKADDTGVEGTETDVDGDGWSAEQDCDDNDPEVHPDAAEWCNGIDDDCDDEVDEGDAVDRATWYADGDDDGFGEASSTVAACDAPSGYAATGDDCDDADPTTYPSAPEICGDDVQNDCDGATDPCLISGTLRARYADASLVGLEPEDGTGSSVASAGDVNADGFDDLLIGAPLSDTLGDNAGVAYLVLGPVAGEIDLSIADATLRGKEVDAEFGHAVAGAGDVNADGFDDLLIGAPYSDAALEDAGAAYLVLGPATGDIDTHDASASLAGITRYDWTGWSVAGAGDVNADGFDDLLIGAPYSDKGGSNAGAAFVMLGPVSGDFSLHDATAQLFGEADNDSAGVALGSAGDVDGDGLDDLIIGAPRSTIGGDDAGAAYLVLGDSITDLDLGSAAARLVGQAANDGAGAAVAGAGDVDGDGLADLLVGASTNDAGGTDAGAAYLLLGTVRGSTLLDEAHARFLGESSFDQAGLSVAGAGDTDGDGHADILVGAPNQDAIDTDAGAAYLMLGPVEGEWVLSAADVSFVGEQAMGHTGSAVSGAGDVNGDGVDELLVGAPDTGDAGTAYLLTIVDW